MIEPGIVLAGAEKDTGVGLSRLVHLPLAFPGTRFVNALGHHLCDPILDRSVQADAEDIGPFSERHHPGPAKDDASGGVCNLP